MQETQPRPTTPTWGRLAGIAIGLVLSKVLLDQLFDRIPHLPPRAGSGIVSAAQLSGIDNRQNYLVFGLCVVVVTLLVWLLSMGLPLWSRQTSDPLQPADAPKKASGLKFTLQYWFGDWVPVLRKLGDKLDGLSAHSVAFTVLSGVLLATWIVNAEFMDLSQVIIPANAFHEGEYLGFGQTLAQLGGPYTSAFFIHGFGINALPDLLAQQLGFRANSIAAARLVRVLESSVAWLGAAWAIYELVRANSRKGRRALPFLITLVTFMMLNGIAFDMTLRRSLSLLQLAALFWLMRADRHGVRTLIMAFVLGLSIPLALLYDYSETVWFLAVFAISSPLVLLREGRGALRWLTTSAGGMGVGAVALAVGLGGDQLHALLGQLVYWAHYGREIWFIPLSSGSFHGSKSFALIVLAPSLTIAYLAAALFRQQSLRTVLREHAVLVTLLLASLLGDRVGLDRALEEHLRWSAVNNGLLLLALTWSALKVRGGEAGSEGRHQWPHALATAVAVAVMIPCVPVNAEKLSPLSTIGHLLDYAAAFRTPDDALLSDSYRQARAELGTEISKSGSFYVLNSDAMWYRVFQKPSASPFHHLAYARAPEGQAEVVRDLERQRPEFILVSGYASMNGIAHDVANPAVYRYVLEHYRPYKHIGRYGFWRRSPQNLWSCIDGPPIKGAITGFHGTTSIRTALSGYLELPTGSPAEGPLTFYVSWKAGKALIAAEELEVSHMRHKGRHLEWSLDLPVAAESTRPQDLQVWLYQPGDRLIPVGSTSD